MTSAPLNPQYPKLKQSFHAGPRGVPQLSQIQAAFVIWTNQHWMFGCLFSGKTLCFKQKLCWQVLWLRKMTLVSHHGQLGTNEKENMFFLILLCKMNCMALAAFWTRVVKCAWQTFIWLKIRGIFMVIVGLFYVSGFAWWRDVKALTYFGKNGLGLIWEQVTVVEICIFSWFRPLEGRILQ